MAPRVPVNAWRLPPEPVLEAAAVVDAAGAAAAVVEATAVSAADEDAPFAALFEAPDPVLPTTRPWSSIGVTEAKLVVIPNTALNASACERVTSLICLENEVIRLTCAPVLAVAAAAACCADAQVSLAVWSAPQELVRVSQMNWVIMPMA